MSRLKRHCLNCDEDYEGNYCPRCGQAANTGKLGWNMVWEKVIDVWDVEQHSLPLTIWHLIWRPGYLIRDYLDGRRQLYYSPVMLLIMLGVAITLVKMIPGEGPDHTPIRDSVTLDAFMKWVSTNMGWGYIILNSFLILPTWIAFRYSPLHSRHTLPEGFFIHIITRRNEHGIRSALLVPVRLRSGVRLRGLGYNMAFLYMYLFRTHQYHYDCPVYGCHSWQSADNALCHEELSAIWHKRGSDHTRFLYQSSYGTSAEG